MSSEVKILEIVSRYGGDRKIEMMKEMKSLRRIIGREMLHPVHEAVNIVRATYKNY